MTTLKEQYAELVALAQLYLLQEHPSGSWLTADSDTFNYFKRYALQTQQKRSAPTPPPRQQPSPEAVPAIEQTTAPVESAAPHTHKQPPTPPAPADTPKDPVLTPPTRLMKDPLNTAGPTKKAPKEVSTGFILEPLTEIPTLNDSELKKAFLERFPFVNWLEVPVKDLHTAEASPQTAANIVILLYSEAGKTLAFMHNLAKAIQLTTGNVEVISASQIEAENGWEEFLKSKKLRLIITSYGGAQSLPGLMTYAKESPKQGNHYFGKVPACLLSDVNIYLKEPQLKLPLWQSIQSLYHHGK